jgi:hypothetical protein
MSVSSTPPLLLREKKPAVIDLARHLGITRYQAYGLVDPSGYPVPKALFDTRSDVAVRVARLIGWTITDVREFYDKAA